MFCKEKFQPFLRFWLTRRFLFQPWFLNLVSTLLEILELCKRLVVPVQLLLVSTLLEILGVERRRLRLVHVPVGVSTLLEILGLVCLVVVGF